jgi:hypothetical protein
MTKLTKRCAETDQNENLYTSAEPDPHRGESIAMPLTYA